MTKFYVSTSVTVNHDAKGPSAFVERNFEQEVPHGANDHVISSLLINSALSRVAKELGWDMQGEEGKVSISWGTKPVTSW